MHLLLAISGDNDPTNWADALQAVLPEARISMWNPDGPAVDADFAVVWRPQADIFAREQKLQAVFNLGAGVDALLALPTLREDIPVIRLEDAGMTVQMSEYALHAVWRASRGFDAYRRAQRQAHWQALPPTDRRAWPVGVLGLGKVGTGIAQSVARFDYPVAGWSRTSRSVAGVDCFAGPAELAAFLGRTRVLVNALPLTAETRDMLDHRLFAQLQPGAHIVNIGRGQHLVEEDLLAALDSGHIASATLDVFRTEPLPVDHPFWQHPRVIVTPHIAARTLVQESVQQVALKLGQMQRGEPVSGVVDRTQGY